MNIVELRDELTRLIRVTKSPQPIDVIVALEDDDLSIQRIRMDCTTRDRVENREYELIIIPDYGS